MSQAIVFDAVSKTYRQGWHRDAVEAVRDVSFAIQEGEAFGFIGPNGAGKSSAIRILMGLSRPSAGAAAVFGVPVSDHLSRQGLGYVPESPYLYDYLTPREILSMSVRLHRVRVDDPRRHIGYWLERLELGKVANAPIRSFSKGMVQRVAIAQALAVRPRLLVLDEPLSGLDPVGRMDVVGLLAEYKAQGGTMFFTSHVLHDVERLADRFGLIHQGILHSVAAPADLAGGDDAVLLRSVGDVAVQGMAAESGQRWSGQFKRDEIWAQLDRLRAAGHQIVEMRPALSLETAFLKFIGKKI